MWRPADRALKSASARAIGAVVARFVHTEEVTGSNPVSPTVGCGSAAVPSHRRGHWVEPSIPHRWLWERASFTPKRSLVRTQYRPPLAVVARLCRRTEEVTGSNPVSPTVGCGSALRSHRRGHWFEPSIAHRWLW